MQWAEFYREPDLRSRIWCGRYYLHVDALEDDVTVGLVDIFGVRATGTFVSCFLVRRQEHHIATKLTELHIAT
jgi:hypothetical protein